MIPLDSFDVDLLMHLQRDGKTSTQELAEKSNLSASPCWRRVRKMEDTGLIKTYVAILDPKALGLFACAYIHVSLIDHSEATREKFDSLVQSQEEITECSAITGEHDFVLKVFAENPEALEIFIMRQILGSNLVRASKTDFVLRQTKTTTALPLGHRR